MRDIGQDVRILASIRRLPDCRLFLVDCGILNPEILKIRRPVPPLGQEQNRLLHTIPAAPLGWEEGLHRRRTAITRLPRRSPV